MTASSEVESSSPRVGLFLIEGLLIAFLFWADIHHFHHVVILSKTPYLFVLGWISLRLRRKTWRSVGMSAPSHWPQTLLVGVAAGCIMELLELFVTQPLIVHLFHQPPDLNALTGLRHNLGMLGVALALAWTLAAFGEELVWRGYVLNRIAELLAAAQYRFVIAVVISSAFFGVAHYDQGVTGIVENAIDGAILACLYLSSGCNLWVAILAHGLTDTVDCLLLYSGHYPISS